MRESIHMPRLRAASWRQLVLLLLFSLITTNVWGASPAKGGEELKFPPPLESYDDAHMTNSAGKMIIGDVLKHRARTEPFNVVATLLFLCAVLHTFMTHRFRHMAHVIEEKHKEKHRQLAGDDARTPVKKIARLLHFLGEIEAVFGIWVLPAMIWLAIKHGPDASVDYLNSRSYAEPIFVVVIMAISATRPVLNLAEAMMRKIAGLGGGKVVAWWFSILTIGPLLGSFITEPAAMTICAMLLVRQFYRYKPQPRFAYATLGVLFVNISVGGTLTHFAAPPVLMVAGPWGWDTAYMCSHFGWVAATGIVTSNIVYYLLFRKHFAQLQDTIDCLGHQTKVTEARIPLWVTIASLIFMGMAVRWAHYPVLLIGCFLFFLAFFEITEDYQGAFQLRSPILVGFFLAGLVIHGGMQQWWIAPVLGSLSEIPLMFGSIVLTAFNDNAAITYLATLVPGLTDSMKQAVVQGAVIGGGLTVIANAPNPAGQSILNDHFKEGIAPIGLLLGALIPTGIQIIYFLTLGQLN